MARKGRGWHGESERHALAASGIKTARMKLERVPGTGARFRITGVPKNIESEAEFRKAVASLQEEQPGGRYGGPGLIYFDTPEGLFGIRFGKVVRIPYRGVWDYDPRFKTLDEFLSWIKKQKDMSVMLRWEPYPEDERFYEVFTAHWLR